MSETSLLQTQVSVHAQKEPDETAKDALSDAFSEENMRAAGNAILEDPELVQAFDNPKILEVLEKRDITKYEFDPQVRKFMKKLRTKISKVAGVPELAVQAFMDPKLAHFLSAILSDKSASEDFKKYLAEDNSVMDLFDDPDTMAVFHQLESEEVLKEEMARLNAPKEEASLLGKTSMGMKHDPELHELLSSPDVEAMMRNPNLSIEEVSKSYQSKPDVQAAVDKVLHGMTDKPGHGGGINLLQAIMPEDKQLAEDLETLSNHPEIKELLADPDVAAEFGKENVEILNDMLAKKPRVPALLEHLSNV